MVLPLILVAGAAVAAAAVGGTAAGKRARQAKQIALVGPPGSGKTTLAAALAGEEPPAEYTPTTQVNRLQFEVELGGKPKRLEVVDTAGRDAVTDAWRDQIKKARLVCFVVSWTDLEGSTSRVEGFARHVGGIKTKGDRVSIVVTHADSAPNQTRSEVAQDPRIESLRSMLPPSDDFVVNLLDVSDREQLVRQIWELT